MVKRLFRFALAAVLLLIVIGGVAFWYISRSGSGKLEGWIGSQLQTIANSYLNPKLSFTDLDYTYPFTVSLKNLRLTADDPSHPGQPIDVIACESAGITLAEIPSVGKPIVIEKISLHKPQISAVAATAGSREFVGFSNLIRAGALSRKPEEKPSGAPTKLSDVFRMRLVELVDGKIVYDPRIPGTVPMTLDQINTTLNIAPTNDGWYKLNVAIARKPVFDVTVGGALNLDTFNVRDIDVKMLADLGTDKLDYLPPELQQLLKQYDGKGKLSVSITGNMPVMEPMKGDIHADVKLKSAHVAVGDFQLPVENLALSAKFADGKATLDSLNIAALGGTADLSGSATLNDRLDADLNLKVAGMVLENLLATGPGKNAAKLDLDFHVAGSLLAIIGQVPPPKDAPLAAISLKNFHLSADDPVHPGTPVDVVAVKNLDVALAEPIISGKPIVIEKIILDEPVLSAIAVAPNSFDFVGVPKLPPSIAGPTTVPVPSSEPVASAQKSSSKISDLIRVKTFQLNNAKVVYDPRLPETQRMWLDHINTSLKVDPADAGVYVLSTKLGRDTIFNLAVDGRINIDHPAIENLKLNLAADLTQGQTDFLVPQLQVLLKQTEAKGKLTFTASGSVPFGDLNKAILHAESTLEAIDLAAGDQKVPVDSFKLKADLADGKLEITNFSIAALGSTFNLKGTALLNDRMDTDLTLQITGVPIEKVLAALQPNVPAAHTMTLLDADVRIRTSVAALMGGAPPSGEPLVNLTVKNFHLTADDAGDRPVQFLSLESLEVNVASLPAAGKPMVVENVILKKPAIRAVVIASGSNEFVGISNLQKLGEGSPSVEATTKPAVPAPSTKPSAVAATARLSDLIRVNLVLIDDASIYYDPMIDKTVQMSIDHISLKVTPTSQAGDVYAFQTLMSRAPDFSLNLGGRVDINALKVDGLALTMTTDLGKKSPSYLPPQIQQLLTQYAVQGVMKVEAGGSAPLTNPLAADLNADIRLDSVQATSGGFTIPVEHVRLPARVKDRQLTIIPAESMGGAMAEVFEGTIDLTGVVNLDEYLHSTLDLKVKNLQLKHLATAKQPPDPQLKDLTGTANVTVHLDNAPLLVIAAHAAPPSTQPSVPDSPLRSVSLPDKWGNGEVTLTDARLAGLELIQKMGNFAKSAYFEIVKQFDRKNELTIKPKENAHLIFAMTGDRIAFSEVFYEGEVVAVEGTGDFTLGQMVDFTLKGGPWAKFGEWVKNNVNSLLTYRITGKADNPNIAVKNGDGKVITDEVKELASKAGEGIDKGLDATKKGLDKAGGFIGDLFGGKKKKDGE